LIETFLKDPYPNTLAVLVLTALVITLVVSILVSKKNLSVSTSQGWYAWLLPTFTALALPAVFDLLHLEGTALIFACLTLLVLLSNIIISLLHISGRFSTSVVRDWYKWSILMTAGGGLALTLFISFLEAAGGDLKCGVTTGCGPVTNSRYSLLFDILPVEVFGLAGYVAILIAWFTWQYGPASMRSLAAQATLGLCMFGVMFSIYLTFLEPFVIGATCMWCICSAVLTMVLLLDSIPTVQQTLTMEKDDYME
jgi:uncharacterized membrane protein